MTDWQLPKPELTVSLRAVRRLAAAKQHLAGKLPTRATKEDLISVLRDTAYVQWDPVPIVAPSHVISFWSRIGDFRLTDLDDLLWREKKLFLHCIPMASIVLTHDYPIYNTLMERYPESLSTRCRNHIPRARMFQGSGALRKSVLNDLKEGPRVLNQFKDHRPKRSADGWSSGSDVSNMLYHLQMVGEVMVVGHRGNQNVWGLTKDFLSGRVRPGLSAEGYERTAAERAIRALGTATPRELFVYFVRGRYLNHKGAVNALSDESKIRPVRVEGIRDREQRYVHESDLKLLETIDGGAWRPRLSLIPPFDNLLAGGERLERLYSFEYAREQFLPKAKRRYGTYVVPLFWDDRFIGRIDPEMDRAKEKLVIHSVHAEPGPVDGSVGPEIARSIGRFAEFLGAKEVEYGEKVPDAWSSSLR